MALALYRRYRPDTFEGVIGQDQVTVPLMRALDEGKLTHAYLFSGPRGCGKTSSARILARCINCVKGPTSHPCGECESCKDLATGGPGSIDVVEIDAASHNGVDDARELRERAGFAPARDRYKIFILDEAHMVTQQGFNALLKIVEEPPEHVMFIFATTEPDKVIGTIRSRTHHYPFRLVPAEVMGPYLETICEKEGIKPEPGVLKLAMRAGGGSMRDTLSVLDQLMVGSVNGVISHDSAVALLGFTPEALIGEAVDAVIDRNGEALYGVIQKVVVGGFDPRRFVEDLLARVRDLLVLTLAGDRAESVLSDTAEGENMGDLHRQASALGLPVLTSMADIINTTLGNMTGAISPRMRLELLAARLLAGRENAGAGAGIGGGSASAGSFGGASAGAGAGTPGEGAPAPAQRGGFAGSSRRGGFAGASRNQQGNAGAASAQNHPQSAAPTALRACNQGQPPAAHSGATVVASSPTDATGVRYTARPASGGGKSWATSDAETTAGKASAPVRAGGAASASEDAGGVAAAGVAGGQTDSGQSAAAETAATSTVSSAWGANQGEAAPHQGASGSGTPAPQSGSDQAAGATPHGGSAQSGTRNQAPVPAWGSHSPSAGAAQQGTSSQSQASQGQSSQGQPAASAGASAAGVPSGPDNRTPDQKWDAAVASLPEEIREYVSRDKVPTVAFETNAMGKSRLSMTFDRALSQHAFALAVATDEENSGKKASIVVLEAVRKQFGAATMIAPTPVAANGEKVESTRRMTPEQLTQVKKQIALAKAGLAAAGLMNFGSARKPSESREQHAAKAEDASAADADDASHRAGGTHSASGAATPGEPSGAGDARPVTSGQAPVTQGASGSSTRGISRKTEVAGAAAGSSVDPRDENPHTADDHAAGAANAHDASAGVNDDEEDPWLRPSSASVQSSVQSDAETRPSERPVVSAQDRQSTAARQDSASSTSMPAAQTPSAGEGHHTKHVAVPDLSDDTDPWAAPAQAKASPAAGAAMTAPAVPKTAVGGADPWQQPNQAASAPANAAPEADPWQQGPAVATDPWADQQVPPPEEAPMDDDPWGQQPSAPRGGRSSFRDGGRPGTPAQGMADDSWGQPAGTPAAAPAGFAEPNASGMRPGGLGNVVASVGAGTGRGAATPGTPASTPSVDPDEDEYSMSDESLGSATAMSLDDLKKFFEVKKTENFAADDPKNPRNIAQSNKHDD